MTSVSAFAINGQASSPSATNPVLPLADTRLTEKVEKQRITIHSEASDISIDTTTSLNTDYTGPIIPPNCDKSLRRRTLVICFDGTGDQFDLDNSNVISFFSVLKKGDRKRQLVYYQSGIGTYTIPQVATPIYSKVQKTLDLMFASNLNHHVMSGYHFLMENYEDGDKICIFGFSRGAYTARALAGMIHKVGLLPAGNSQQVPFAYKMYKNDTEMGWRQSVAFKRTFSMDVDIDFVGVWDTVASVGLLPTTLPFTKSNTAIKVFRHALSLDERRAKFRPSTYERITAEEAKRGDFAPPTRAASSTVTRGRKMDKTRGSAEVKDINKQTESHDEAQAAKQANYEPDNTGYGGKAVTTVKKLVSEESSNERRSNSGSRSRTIVGTIKRKARKITDNVQEIVERVSISDRERSRSRDRDEKENLSPDSERDQLEQMYLDRSRPTDVLEVWFAGCHCDVGGGSVPNSTKNSLARIPLRWMIRECFLARTGIQFEADSLRELGLDPVSLYPRVIKVPHPSPEDARSTVASPEQIPAPLPSPNQPLSSNTKSTAKPGQGSEPTPKEEVKVSMMEGTAEDCAQEMEKAVTVVEADDNTVPPNMEEVSALRLDPGERRENNISMDGTLVNFNSESTDALPNVCIENASVMDERISIKSEEHQVAHSVPHLEGVPPPKKQDDTLKPVPHPRPVLNRRLRDECVTALEAESNAFDARTKVYDQLEVAKWWWILEFIPFRESVQQKDGTWKKKWSINRGRGRAITQDEPLLVHRSVKMRMGAEDLKYTPRVKFEKEPIWID